MQLARLWNLNHDLMTSLRLLHAHNLPKIPPHLHRWNSVRVQHPCAHPQHLKVLQHFIYMIWMWDAVSGALEPQP